MKNIKSVIIFLVVAFVLVFGITLLANNFFDSPQTSSLPDAEETTIPKDTTQKYTLEDVTSHSNATSCWTIVHTDVYDLTSWIKEHPGGPEAILGICGKDATAAFEAQHGGQREPENELKKFQIGVYKNN